MHIWLIILISIGIITILGLITALIVYSVRNSEYVSKSEVLSKFNNTKYNSDGSPQGGVLVSLFDNLDVCPDYDYTISTDNNTSPSSSNTCKTDADQCTSNGAIINPGDITQVLTAVKQQGAGTNCFALDTTYLRKDLPQYVFGPYQGGDMTVGIIIDTQIIFDYIACMFPIDSGSIIRYNTTCVDDNIETYIQNASEASDKSKAWDDYISSSDSVALGSAGCGNPNANGLNNYTSASQYFMWTDESAQDQINIIKQLTDNQIINSWSTEDSNKPFSKYQWKYWAKAVQYVYSKASEMGDTFIYSQILGNDGYRENEVDIYIPNETGVSCTDTDQQECNVKEDFKSVFAKAIIGVISVAQDNASTAESISKYGPGGFGCVDGKTCQNPSISEKCGKSNDVYDCLATSSPSPSPSPIASNNCCYDSDSGKCYSATDTYTICCSNTDLSESLAKRLASNWNTSDYRVKYGGRKIRAYKMRVENIYNFDYTLGQEKNLNLTEII